ncbi:MAG: PhzF family phenazine biosynthesis protein [Oscillospiraceae bacterium]|nr:PhzF family phenazine biosynthesis protein [Oscillospiraceae bacterium]
MKYYVADAFAEEIFKGNPAGVCVSDTEMSAELMQKIAFENNLSETAFLVKCGEKYGLRWFTPLFEIDLCGHATLASAFIVMNYIEPYLDEVRFFTVSGEIVVRRNGELYEMRFPERVPPKIEVTAEITEALGLVPNEIYSGRDLFAVLENEEAVRSFSPNYEKLGKLDKWLGISVTAKGENADFVSRFFCPELKLEDPVTGSAHSSLVPLWSEKLGKTVLEAEQLSQRGGKLYCELGDGFVKIAGKAVLYLKGEIFI